MIYLLIDTYEQLRSGWLSPLRVFLDVEFRAVIAIILAFTIVMALGDRTVRFLLRLKIGDNPEFDHKDLNQLMKQKANTPTMGGALVAGAILVTTLLLANLASFYIVMALICLVWLAVMGGADDWLKLTSARRMPGSRQGLYTAEKLLLQIGLAVVLGIFLHHHAETKFTLDLAEIREMGQSLTLPFMRTWVYEDGQFVPSPNLIVLGMGSFVLLAILVIVGTSNAVNLTDGMDGLAAGIMVIVSLAFMVLAFVAGLDRDGFQLAKYLLVPHIPFADELAIVAGAMAGASLGFLWFNAHPAQMFMGDTGSLTLGGLLGFIAVAIRQEFLLLIVGFVFVMEAASVLLQVGYFKLTGGRRIFRCAPIHHHFHLAGWTEQQVVVRFWLMTAVAVAVALATIKLR